MVDGRIEDIHIMTNDIRIRIIARSSHHRMWVYRLLVSSAPSSQRSLALLAETHSRSSQSHNLKIRLTHRDIRMRIRQHTLGHQEKQREDAIRIHHSLNFQRIIQDEGKERKANMKNEQSGNACSAPGKRMAALQITDHAVALSRG